MNCAKCGASVFDRMLDRINPVGEDGIFWCIPCIEKHEQELAKNIKEDQDPVIKDLHDIFYPNNK